MKGQSSVMDGIIFIMVCSVAATLLFYTTSLYGANTNTQIVSVYNYEYAGTALVSIHYAKDSDSNWFWNELKSRLNGTAPEASVRDYVRNKAPSMWNNITSSSPSSHVVLEFDGTSTFYCNGTDAASFDCYPNNIDSRTIFSSSTKITDAEYNDWEIILQLHY